RGPLHIAHRSASIRDGRRSSPAIAVMFTVIPLDLDVAVPDTEEIMEQLACAREQQVRIARVGRHEMRGERSFGRAQRPDVKVVDRGDPLELAERPLDLLDADPRRTR